MFRFIALSWQASDLVAAAAVGHISHGLQGDRSWSLAMRRPGLHVFTAGARDKANRTYITDDQRSIVVGKLFRRSTIRDVPGNLDADTSSRIHRTRGRTLVEDFWGRYVAFLTDAFGSTSVLRDPSGTLPCHVVRHGQVTITFSWLEDVLALLPDLPRLRVDSTALAAHLAHGELNGTETALCGVKRVLAGELVSLDREQERELTWDPLGHARVASAVSAGEAMALLRDTVRGCTTAWASCYDALLLRLSGGLDSSILADCLTHAPHDAKVVCVNYHSPGTDSDERPYARLVAARSQLALVELERDSDFRLESVLTTGRTPTPTNYLGRMGSARMDAELSQTHGAAAMFTGGGGDQLFYEFRKWWPAADYLRVRGLDRGFMRAALDAARLGQVSVWTAMRLAQIDRFRTEIPLNKMHRHWTLVTDEVGRNADQSPRFVHPSLLAATDLPIGKLMHLQNLLYPAPYYDPIEQSAAPELVNPLMSQPLIELCLQLPTFLLCHGGRSRSLARQAFAQDLPAEIARRRSKGGLEEHIQAVLFRNIGFARQMLLDGELVQRGLLSRPAVEKALASRTAALGSQAGEIHMYIGIEAWLQRWRA